MKKKPGIEWHLDIYPVVGGHEFQVRLSTFKKKPTDDKAFAVIKKYFPSVRRIVKKFEDRK